MCASHPISASTSAVQSIALNELERSVYAALEMYSNVHRGSGQFSQVSTALFERARDIILQLAGGNAARHIVVFCTPARARALSDQLKSTNYHVFSSQEIGLPVGLRALVVPRSALPKGVPLETGGGTIRLVSQGNVVWASAPDRFEAGTPPILNVVAFARALQMRAQGWVIQRIHTSHDGISPSQTLDHDDYYPEYSGSRLLEQLSKDCVGKYSMVPTDTGMRRYINFDNAASTPAFSAVWEAVRQTWRMPQEHWPAIVQKVKHSCAQFFDAPNPSYEVLFTSNTTEAINLSAQILQTVFAQDASTRPVILNTLLEHHSNELPWRVLAGADHIRLPVSDQGFLDLDLLEQTLREYNQEAAHGTQRVRLVAVCGASNVLGTVNDLQEISRITHQYGAFLLVDAAQMAAHRAIRAERWGIDLLAISAHKMYAPFGTGALILRRELLDHFSEEHLESRRISGEENITGIAALGKAIQLLQRVGMETVRTTEDHLTAQALRELTALSGVEVYGVC